MNEVEVPADYSELIFAGHSLGGTAAMCLGMKYPNSRVVSLNGGAPPTSPVRQGPGPERATHYHVFGDIISSHMDPAAARVIRIRKVGQPEWMSSYPHSSDRMMKGDQAWVYSTAEEEQESWIRWGKRHPLRSVVVQIVCQSPIPGSTKRCGIVDYFSPF